MVQKQKTITPFLKGKKVTAVKKGVVEKTRQRTERGTGLKFKTESYELISRCTGKTRVKYAPNPKTPGSKSFDRYKKYQNSKTVGEALKHCKPADLLWEYERGYLKILGGPMADKPACMAPPSSDPAIKILSKFRGPQGCSIKIDGEVRKKLTKWASEFGMDLDQLHEEAGKTCNSESADIQTSRVIANELAKRKLLAKKTSEKDVVEVLELWGFAENDSRLNVMPEGTKFIHSDTLGILRLRNGTYRIFDPTIRYAHFTKLICEYLEKNKAKDIPSDFGFTGININHNYAGRRHRDNNNEGPSTIKALGKFSGGKLNYFPKDIKRAGRCPVEDLNPKDANVLDLAKSFKLFNGNSAHGVHAFKGQRFSLVYFTTAKWWKIPQKECKHLTKLGFKVPTKKSMDSVKACSKKMDEQRAASL